MTEAQLAEVRERVEAAGLGGTPWEAYIVILDRKNRETGEVTYSPYMAVDGRVAQMLGEAKGAAVTIQTWANLGDEAMLAQGEPGIVVPPGHALARVITPRGVATGTARVFVGGSGPHRETPVEVAETSAIGRALAAMGYGLLPGAGLVSAEEVMLAAEAEPSPGRGSKEPTARAPETPPPSGDGRRPRITKKKTSGYQREQIVTMYAAVHGVERDEARKQVEALFAQRFGHPMERASYDEGCKVIAELLPEWNKGKEWAAA